jgi:hypothetical protein
MHRLFGRNLVSLSTNYVWNRAYPFSRSRSPTNLKKVKFKSNMLILVLYTKGSEGETVWKITDFGFSSTTVTEPPLKLPTFVHEIPLAQSFLSGPLQSKSRYLVSWVSSR